MKTIFSIFIFFSSGFGFAQTTPTLRYSGVSVTSAVNTGISGYEIYSPATVQTSTSVLPKLWFGGWLRKFDMPADNIYVSDFENGVAKNPRPIKWYNSGYPLGHLPNYHVNDPTIVYGPDSRYPFYFMYYTVLCNDYLRACAKELKTSAPPKDEVNQMFKRNWVGAAASFDQGNSWVDLGVILGQSNGYDNSGAWSPSALVRGSEIHLYYHTNPYNCFDLLCSTQTQTPSVLMRTRLQGNGWQRVKTEQLMGENGQPLTGINNVDVRYEYGKYWLTGNVFGSGDPVQTTLVLYFSTDGINFTPYNGTDGVIIRPTGLQLITPHIIPTSADSFDLHFAFAKNFFVFGGGTYLAKWKYILKK